MIDIRDKERVLALWQRKELTYAQIASEVGLSLGQVASTIYRHVHRDRSFDAEADCYYDEEAASRGISKRAIVIRLLRRIADDDLCKAILDD